jgi:para-nitrobenzyl esterase
VINPPEGRGPWTPEYLIPGATSEDCLYLNVWRPVDASVKRAPVFVWIHGGGNTEGSGSVPVYDGAAMAGEGVVVVTINYRLGVLGFMAHPELTKEQGGSSGNYALADIIAALKWVKANAAAFGGDAARVTIAGQSAGAANVNSMIASPAAKGLFSRTIAQSGSSWTGRKMTTPLATGEKAGAAFGTRIGAQSLASLRALSGDELIRQAAATQSRFGTVVDGKILSDTAIVNDVPALSGYNADEGSADERYGQWTAEEFARNRSNAFGPVADAAARIYVTASDTEIGRLGKTMLRDRSRANIYQWAKHRAPNTRSPIYIYMFDHPLPGPKQARYGTFHTGEMAYVFGNLEAPGRVFTDKDRDVSKAMMSRWISFMKSGSPNAPGLATWTAFDGKPSIMELGNWEGMAPVLPAEKLALSDDQVAKVAAGQTDVRQSAP